MNKSLSTPRGQSLYQFAKTLLLPVLLFLWGNIWGQTTVTHTFAGTSGTIDSNISFTTQSNSASNAPAFNAGDNTLRLYFGSASPYNGCSITLIPSNGATITAVELTGVTGNTPVMRYSIGTTATTLSDPALALAGNIYTVSSLSVTSSLKIRNANTSNTHGRFTGIKVTYTPGGPTIASSATTLTGFSATPSTPSAPQTFNVSGSSLGANISVTPPTNYEISLSSASGYTSSAISLTQTSGTVPSTPIFVRLKSGLALGAYNGEVINITSGSATAKTVTLSGDVVRNTIISTTSGDWNTGTTWVGGVVPTSGDNVVISTGHTVSVAAGVTRDTGVTTTVNGSFQLNNGGYAGGAPFTYAATGSGLIFNNGSVYGVGVGNAFWPTTTPPFNVTINSGSGAKLDTPVGLVSGTLTLNGQLNAVNAITVNGTLQLNNGGFVSSNAPVYGASSTLVYNTTYGVGTEWTTTGTTAGSGIPNHVTIQNNAAVTYGAVGARGLAGNLTITSGSLTSGDILNVKGTTTNVGTLTTNSTANFTGLVTNSGTFNSNGVSNLAGNFTNSVTAAILSLGGDFYLGGNWANAGTFTPNNKAVFFNGATGTQSITNTNSSNSNTETFAYLVNNKAAGTLSITSNIIISGTSGDVFQIINSAATSLNGANRTITFNGNGGNILVSGAERTITGTSTTAAIVINGTKTVRSTSGGTLVLGTNITTKLSNGINFGAGLTTVSTALEINNGGYVITNAPIYASTSTLTYNVGAGYGVNNEWTGNATTAGAGIPQNVIITGNTIINMPNSIRGLAGNLSINALSSLNMNNTIGADLALGGNFTNNGTFAPNNTAVIFNGNDTTQTISGATAFDYFIVNKTGTFGTVTLASSIIINKDLTLTSRSITLSSFNLTLPNKSSVITSNANSYINATGTGKLIRQNIDGTADWIFPMGVAATLRYAPLTVKNLSGTTEIGVNVNATLSKSVSVAANTLKTEWRVSTTNNVTANVRADWTATEQNTGVVNPGPGDLGVYNSTVGSNYTLYDVTLAQYNTQATGVVLANTGTNSIVIGNDDSIILSNDECLGAKIVVVDAVSISGSNTGATTSTGAVCGGSVASDVWFKFTTSEAGSYKINVVGASGVDPILNLYSGTCGSLTSLACTNATGSGGTEFITQPLSANTIYYYRVYTLSALYQGAFTTNVVTVPTITVNPTSLAFGDVSVTTDSTVKTFSVQASLLTSATGNIDLNAPAGYLLSLDGTTAWSSVLNLPFTGSKLAETIVYTKFNPSTCGDFNSNITASGGGATSANVAVTGKGVISAPTANSGTDITATTFAAHWNGIPGATGYLLDVYFKGTVVNTLINATFDDVAGTGGNSGGWNGSIATGSIPTAYTTAGWVFNSSAGADKSIKAGSGSNLGSVTTPELAVNGSGTLTFRAGAWDGTSESTTLKLTATNATLSTPTVTLVKGSFSTYSVNITGATGNVKISFTGNTAANSRFFIDDIKVTTSGIGNIAFSGYNPKTIAGGSTVTEVVNGLSSNTQYYYTVRATTATCESANSSEIEVTTNNTVIWNTGAWSNTTGPDATLDAIIRSPFVVGANASQATFTVKDLTVENTGLLEIPANQGITVAGKITTADNKIVIDSDGSLLQTNSPAANDNSGKIIAKRDVKMSKTDYTYWSTPVTGQKLLNNAALGDGFSVGTPNNRIYDYYEPTDNFKATADSNFANAKGYAIRGKDTYSSTVHTLDTDMKFTGVPNNGSYVIDIQKSKNTVSGNPLETYTHGYNLIGNPYPSNINFIQFYNLERGDGTKNSDVINAKAWFWTNSSPTKTQSGSSYAGNNYATITLAGGTPPTIANGQSAGTPIPNEFIKVGQGFIVEMLGTPPTGNTPLTANLKFDNTIRTNNSTGHFYNNNKSSDAINRYWVKMISPENVVNTILVAHMDGATNQYDANYDAELLAVGDDSFYSKLNTQKLQIQARSNPLTTEDVIPLGNKYSANGNYKISLGNKEGIFAGDQKIYLLDKLNNLYTDLSVQDYIFTASKGTDDTRFEIVYRNQEVLGTDNLSKSDFSVYRDGTSFVIRSTFSLGKIELYDASGKLVIATSSNQKEFRLDAAAIASGVYIIRAENSGNIRTKKIIK
ncbi:T9SS type A sorting domain-containing protein [Chryseobacterium sp. KACC 21268]|nr:T9SS type A sorting domain-containing protein [Chryseobacterium sp. KACC 21268]